MTFEPALDSLVRGPGLLGRRTVLLAGALALTAAHVAPAAAATVRLPESTTLEYAVKASYHGLPLQTDATLLWQRDGDSYRAEWTVRVPFVGERTQRSEGRVTAAGLRPHEYVEQTNKRRSARFDYDAKRVVFSDGRDAEPLEKGAQDRLTVSLQLGALLAAEPDRAAVGHTLTLPVVGVRGAEVWHWDVKAQEEVIVDGHRLDAFKLERQPRQDEDSQIAVWLAPGVQYLPVRLRVKQESGDVVDQQLSTLP